MNTSAVQAVITEARKCAMAMLESGTFILQELPNVRMDPELLASATDLCNQLIGTNFDVIPELMELDDLLSYGGSDEDIASAVDLVMGWLSDDIPEMLELARKLQAAAANDRECESASVLVTESALNVLDPFNRARAAADLIIVIDRSGNS